MVMDQMKERRNLMPVGTFGDVTSVPVPVNITQLVKFWDVNVIQLGLAHVQRITSILGAKKIR